MKAVVINFTGYAEAPHTPLTRTAQWFLHRGSVETKKMEANVVSDTDYPLVRRYDGTRIRNGDVRGGRSMQGER